MSLTGAYDPANIFGRILRGEMPSATVWEDDDILTFMDVFPQSDGHVLVISKRSTARNLLEIERDALVQLTAAVQRTARAVARALKPDGVSIVQLNGGAAGQTVFHLHFHIIPRWTDRPTKGHGEAAMAEAATLNAFAARIAAALD